MIKKDREYRRAESFEAKDDSYIVEGYASTFKPYVMYTDADGVEYSEEIDARAFDNADMTDVVFLYNHEGKVYARQKNHTLDITVDEHGLKIRADLSKTEASREMYEEIKSGLIDQMSFAFSVKDEEYDRKKKCRRIKEIRKVYDVSAVSIPANPDTDISARDYFNGEIEMEKAERLAEQKRQEQIARIKLLIEVNNK